MAKVFTNKSSYSLLKTNPKLTGNIKMVVDCEGQIFIESIDASPELTRNKYKRVKLDTENNWSSAVYDFFNGGNIPESILYAIKDNEDFYSIKTDYSKQYYTDYQQGARPKISKLYDEQLSYFAPLWLEPNDIPEYFAIFKVPEPVSVSTKNETEPFTESIETQIYDTNYRRSNKFGFWNSGIDIPNPTGQGEPLSEYFFDTILKDAKLIKVFDMGPDSTLGAYLRTHINDENLPESSLTVDWNINRTSTVNGISLKKSGFTKEAFNVFDESFPVDRTITEYDNFITNQFQNKGVIHANIINLEFLFDDEEDDDFTVNRYFGVYFNRNDISKFKLDSEAFYVKKYANLPQNKEIGSIYDVDVLSDSNILLENNEGVKLFVDYEGDYELLSSDVKSSDFLPYVYSTDGSFYDIKNSVDWGNNEIVLKDTQVNTRDLKGFTKESLGIIPANKTNKVGRSYFEFTINGKVNSFELRVRSVDENDADFNLNQVFVGDTGLDAGTFIGNKFSLAGNPEDVANAIVEAINTYTVKDEDYNIYAVNRFNKVLIFTRGTNAYWNNYEYLLFSDDNNFPNVISVPYKTFESLSDYNAQRLADSEPDFADYNVLVTPGATATYDSGNESILQSNFTGGNDESQNRIRIPIEFKDYFQLDLFLKTQTWYSKIVSVDAYLDEPIFQNGRIVDFGNIDSYVSINTDDNVYVSQGAYCELYAIETNKVGLMSMYPVKQFDVDQFRSDYGKDGDGFVDKLYTNYNHNRLSIPEFPIPSIENGIQNFRDSGFKRLSGKLDTTDGTIAKITNEYDRLDENELAELSIKGRIIPYIAKWVYDDAGKDVRENEYRLTNNSAFSYDNFSPSENNTLPDFRFYTHEWYYLQEYPYYMSTYEKMDSFSYFDENLPKGATSLYDVNNDNFLEYFTQYRVKTTIPGDYVYFPVKRKYSIISGGSDDSFGETFFRGAKIKFKRRVENKKKLNFNIENIGVFKSDEFNDYKFSAVLTNQTTEPLKFSVIENKKFKTITMFIEANLDDYFLNQQLWGGNSKFLDRCSLYILENKYDNTGNVADVELSGAFVPFTGTPGNYVPNFTLSGGFYTINASQNADSLSLPNLKKQVIPNENGSYNKIEIEVTPSVFVVIDGIVSVFKDKIVATRYYTRIGTTEYNFGTTYINYYPTPDLCEDKIPTYIGGGFNAYKGTIEEISFASIFDKVNNGSPEIKYISVDDDGNGNQVITNNEFLMEFEPYSTNVKADYITTEPVIFNGVKNSDFKPIGSRTVGLDKTYFTTMYRFNGNYNPKVEDVILYSEDFGTKFNDEIIKKLRFTNVQFFSTYPNFALYKQLYINKINEQNPLTILDLNKDSALRPEFWKIGEISIDKQDSYIFRSCWDHNYHKRFESKIKFVSYPGYIEPKEVSSFLASTIMNIPDSIKLTTYDSSNVIINQNQNNVISGQLLNTKQLTTNMTPSLQPLFEKYVNSSFNYQKLDTLDDDIQRYIKTNILPRYFTQNISAYVKYSSKLSNEPLLELGKTEQELLLDGFVKLENIRFVLQKFSDFDFNFTYSKPSDRNVTLAFVTNISIV